MFVDHYHIAMVKVVALDYIMALPLVYVTKKIHFSAAHRLYR